MLTARLVKDKQTLATLIGGKDVKKYEALSDFDLVSLSRKGLKKDAFESLAKHMGLSKKTFAENVLNLSIKTIERKKHDDLLDFYTSSYIIEVAKVIEHAFDVFEDELKVQKWLNTPSVALNDMKPLELLNMPTGLALVNTILGRIEEGVFS